MKVRDLRIPAVLAAAGCGLGFAGGVVDTMVPGSVADVISLNQGSTREIVSAWAVAVSGLVQLVTLLVWAAAAAHNVRALGREGLRFSPFTTVAWFFFPVANLYMFYRALSEAWRASEPSTSWDTAKPPVKLLAWWLLFLLSILQDDGPTTMGYVGIAVSLAGSILFVLLVFELRDRQQQCAGVLSGTVAPLSGRNQ